MAMAMAFIPRIGAEVRQPLATLGAKSTKERQWSPGLTILSNPQQSYTVAVDVVNESRVIVALLPGEFINSNSLHTIKILMGIPNFMSSHHRMISAQNTSHPIHLPFTNHKKISGRTGIARKKQAPFLSEGGL